MTMTLDDRDRCLIAALEGGLALVSAPYGELARVTGMEEEEVIARIETLRRDGLISRFGIIVRHHELGYTANGMAVWDVPDQAVADLGRRFADFPFVTLCYQRPRRLPDWPYNLFCMVHGRERKEVLAQVEAMARDCGVTGVPHDVLFSVRRFKQRGARYFSQSPATPNQEAAE